MVTLLENRTGIGWPLVAMPYGPWRTLIGCLRPRPWEIAFQNLGRGSCGQDGCTESRKRICASEKHANRGIAAKREQAGWDREYLPKILLQ